MDMWNEPLTRENIEAFYEATVFMAYSSVLQITKETNRAERAIEKSYIDVFHQRSSISGPDVLYVFGDILLNNTNEIVENSPPPENINFSARTLDEYTKNYLLDRILNKIDSTGYKLAEFISSDSKRNKNKSSQKVMQLMPVTPLLVIQLILLAIIIGVVSYAAITIPNRKAPLIDDSNIFSSDSLREEYVSILPYYPLDVNFPVIDLPGDEGNIQEEAGESTTSPLAPVIGTTEASATRG